MDIMKQAELTMPTLSGTIAKEIDAVPATPKREQPIDNQPITNSPTPAPAPTAAEPAKVWPNATIRGEIVFWLGITVGVMQLAFIIWSFAKRK